MEFNDQWEFKQHFLFIKGSFSGDVFKVMGTNDFHETKTPAVFIIGGIGISPVRSMTSQATHNQSPYNIMDDIPPFTGWVG